MAGRLAIGDHDPVAPNTPPPGARSTDDGSAGWTRTCRPDGGVCFRSPPRRLLSCTRQEEDSRRARPAVHSISEDDIVGPTMLARRTDMALQIGDTAPDFEAETTEGRLRFHDWIGDSWAVLFSHPRDFTPVCTTELGTMARLKPEFDKRNVKIIGLSVDPVENHAKWAEDIKETQGFAPNYPMIGDTDLAIAKAWGMLPAATSGDASKRTAADNQT